MNFELHENRKQELINELQAYFRSEHDKTIGDLRAEMLIEFFLAQLGPRIYNQALDDAGAFIREKLIDLEGVLSIPE